MKLPKVGEVVECSFLDHVEDGSEPIEFTVWGRLHSTGRKSIVIVSWAYASGTRVDDSNEKSWSIVKSAITQISKLQKANS